ncbi:MAG: helix-turn-helix domain-containing protein [Acidithiobacillus sp.]|nr:helix-turn-helix domain-containing protein [Acidithiobacillus sp.]
MASHSVSLLARHVRQFRIRRGLTLTTLAELSGVAKSTLSMIENAQGNPTIETIWAIANALGVRFGDLVEGSNTNLSVQSARDASKDPGVKVRFIERYGDSPAIELYELFMVAGQSYRSSAHPPGVRERVIVLSGEMLVGTQGNSLLLHAGQSHHFAADVEHIYVSPQAEATAMVLIEYPGLNEDGSAEYLITRNLPLTQAEWDGVRALIDRAVIEVSQGVQGLMLYLRGAEMDVVEVSRRVGLAEINCNATERWPLLSFVDQDEYGIWLAFLPRQYTSAFHLDPGPDGHTLSLAEQLAAAAEHPLIPQGDAHLVVFADMVNSDSWTLSTLASEILLQQGHLMLPAPLRERPKQESDKARAVVDTDFASHIDVGYYDAFALLRPAYARQVVALAQDILAFDPQAGGGLSVDVGSGSGAALIMLLELLPNLHVRAVEPDETAFAYLCHNTKDFSRVVCERQSLLELQVTDAPVSVVTLIGSSHRVNTAFLFQKVWHALVDGGILCIADEILPSFSSREERNNALVRHHSNYILASMAEIDMYGLDQHKNGETELYRQTRQALTRAVLEAQYGQTGAAVKRCRDLYTELSEKLPPKQPASPIGAFVRYYFWEIQAMVAGFDYEIARKTHVKRLLSLANGSGFDLLRHRQVYASTGVDEWDGGTHVFTFQKRTASFLSR